VRRLVGILLITLLGVIACASSGLAATSSISVGVPRVAGWTGPITVSVTADPGDDPTDTYTMLWDGSASAIAATGGGSCQTTAGQSSLICQLVSGATAGAHTLELRDDLAGTALTSESIAVQPHLTSRLVKLAPLTFTPFKLDHVTDKVNMTFIINKAANVGFQVKNPSGSIIRHSARKSYKAGRHIVRWAGLNDHGTLVTPNTHYWVRVVSTVSGETVTGAWHRVFAKKVVPPKKPVPPTGSKPKCTPGYSPCLVWHGGADYDCAGGSGNGPYYTKPNTVYHVNDSKDIYGLDGNHNGLGCE
jgi:hypothetical protein